MVAVHALTDRRRRPLSVVTTHNSTITKEMIMKVSISSQCMGDRNCNKLCPEVFEYSEEKLLSIVKHDEIPKHLEDIVRRAAAECGADAITIEE